jgi:defect-in-organelle-trafficking protein DotD
MRIPALFSIAAAVSLAAGCAGTQTRPLDSGPAASEPVLERIEKVASEMSGLWAELGRLEQARDPGEPGRLRDYPETLPPELARPISIRWEGELEPLVRELAAQMGYHVSVVGEAPVLPVLVYVSADKKRLGDVLREAGYQAGKRATVHVYAAPKRLVEVVYADA